MPYVNLTLSFGNGKPVALEGASVGFDGNAPHMGTIGGSEAVKAAAAALIGAATQKQREWLEQAALDHLKDTLP